LSKDRFWNSLEFTGPPSPASWKAALGVGPVIGGLRQHFQYDRRNIIVRRSAIGEGCLAVEDEIY
jgi:hypothetical protein